MQAKSRFLLNALFKHRNHYQAVLPYNLNWQITLTAEEREFLKANALVVCDVGARGAAPEELAPFFSNMVYHAFDADKAEAERLAGLPHPYQQLSVFPYYVGRDSRLTSFNLYKRPGESSHYLPNPRFKAAFEGEQFAVEREVSLQSTALDDVYAAEKIVAADFLKLDTQGSELDILRGAEKLLAGACMVEIEVEFLEMYAGQPLFVDVFKHMQERGFDLLYLNRLFGQRSQVFDGNSRGQLVFGDALFGRREDYMSAIPPAAIAKYVLLLINYGHLDIGYHLLQLNPSVDAAYPWLKRRLRTGTRSPKWKRLLINQLDKCIMLLLHARKTNRLVYDSDRSWPSR